MQTRPYTTCPKSMKEFCSIRSASCAPVLLTRYIFTRLSRDGSIRRENFSKPQKRKIHPSRNSRNLKITKFPLREILETPKSQNSPFEKFSKPQNHKIHPSRNSRKPQPKIPLRNFSIPQKSQNPPFGIFPFIALQQPPQSRSKASLQPTRCRLPERRPTDGETFGTD